MKKTSSLLLFNSFDAGPETRNASQTALTMVMDNASSFKTGGVVWIFGLPSAGKTSLANAIKTQLGSMGRTSIILDGDQLRRGLCRDLGYTAEDRAENVRRAAEISKIIVQSGAITIVAMITPSASLRKLIQEILIGYPLGLVYANCPLSVCMNRDVKGLYAAYEQGSLTGLTGRDAAFEIPEDGECLSVCTDQKTVVECADQVIQTFLSGGSNDDNRAPALPLLQDISQSHITKIAS